MVSRRVLAVLVAVEIVIVAVVLVWKRLDGLDLDVYRLGAQAFFEHGDPYGPLPATRNGTWLPFTYPPFAAIAFAPLLVVQLDVALVALTVISVIALAAVIALCVGWYERRVAVAGAVVLGVQVGALMSEPVRATLGFGQVNLLLMVLVAVDALAPMRRWPRGVLIGLAAAVKLTPAVFVLFFLLRKDFRAAARSVAVFAGCAAIAWLIAPRASGEYWTRLMFAGERIGDPGYIGNQSLRGLIARLGIGSQSLVWVVAAVVVLGLAVWVMRRAVHAGQPVLALLACALGGLLVSPVSWTHHWVWGGPVLGVVCWLAVRGGRARAVPLLGLAAVSAFVFLRSPLWDYRDVWPIRESYVLVGLVLLGMLGLLAKPLDDELHAPGERGDVVRVDRGEQADA
ncbi:glycosyltransferase 87 family protein [Amycolatopsis anabasis]|uniref:glycosyltransferase 87 family protein n=1 Tax=Amycolatopsis anabasis TaxID=1840409 RepID=UPI001FE5FFC2|nr:glycosyltransferase 87 family protein [Amycolatopsis anabasis]